MAQILWKTNLKSRGQSSLKQRLTVWRRLVLFSLLLIAIYFSRGFLVSMDTVSNSILPFSILLHHDVFLERYLTGVNIATAYYVRPFHGHYISSYPIGPALTALPFYFFYVLIGGQASFHSGLVLAKLSGALIATTSVVLLYNVLKDLGIKKTPRWFFIVLYALGTETFSISSQALWQHGPAELWLVVFLSNAVKIFQAESPSRKYSYGAGLALGMLLLSRPQDIALAVPFFLLLIFTTKRKYVLHALPLFLMFALFNVLYNAHFYAEPTLRGGPTQIAGILSAPFTIGLAGNLISPSRGLFVFSPWAIVSFFWLTKVFQRSFYRTIYAPTLLAVILYILVYSKLGYWAAGASFGPRYMTDISPALTLLAAGFLTHWKPSKAYHNFARLAVLGLFAAWSILIQFLGTYTPGFRWNFAALPDTFAPPLWSVRNGEISYYFETLKSEFQPAPELNAPSAKFLDVQLLDKPNIYTSGTTPAVFQANTQYSGVADIQNTGSQSWSPYPAQNGATSVSFSYLVWAGNSRVIRVEDGGELLHSVQPGEKIRVYFYFTTPKTPGTYTYLFTLAQGTDRWFQTELAPQNASLKTVIVQ